MSKIYQGHQARKRFGQNFLHDPQVIHQIVRSIHPTEDDNIVEIGPGLGALTTEILPLCKQLQVIELDRDLAPKLEILCQELGELTVHQADALKFDFQTLVINKQKLRVIGNLPYNISTPLLFHLFKFVSSIKDMHFMLQQEVVKRMAASPGNKSWGRLSVMIQYYCQVEKLFDVPPSAFKPAPKVQSAIVKLVPHSQIPYEAKSLKMLDKVVTMAFGQRRKTLSNSLGKLTSPEHLSHLEIDPSVRAEQLSVAQFVKIANSLDDESFLV